tara:strand:+ start:334 stop:783 length:450 start_codon:yes stop_codon:yes gene_type:complete
MTLESYHSLQFHLDKQGKEILWKLARWTKTLGSINFCLGLFNGVVALPLIYSDSKMLLIMIPSLIISGILILMGLQLNKASLNIKNSILNENDRELFNALTKIQRFFFFSSLLYLIGFILLFLILSLGGPLKEGIQNPSVVTISRDLKS